MEMDGQDVRPEPLEDAGSGLVSCSSAATRRYGTASNSARRSPETGPPSSATPCGLGLEGIVSKRIGSRYVSGWTRVWLKTKNPSFQRS